MSNNTKQKIASSVAAAAMALAIPVSAFAGYSPVNRPTFTCATPTNCEGALDHVQFNSFTNAPNYGDERAFFDAKDASDTSGAFHDSMTVKDGQIVHVRIYIHNNANPNSQQLFGGKAIAKNTRVQTDFPKVAATNVVGIAAIMADNATPGRVDDTVTLTGANPFTVSMVPGSAVWEYRPDGKTWTNTKLSDGIFNGTVNLGDYKACFDYSGFVSFDVKVSMPGKVTPSTPVTPTTPSTPATPVTPNTPAPTQTLPDTGAEMGLAGMAGTGALGYATVMYRRSKQALANKMLNR